MASHASGLNDQGLGRLPDMPHSAQMM